MKKYNVLVAGASVLLGLAIFWFSRGLTTISADGVPGEAFWPHMIAWLLIGLGVLQLIEVIAFPATNADRTVTLGGTGNLWAYLTAAVAFGFATLMTWAGFLIAGGVTMPIVMLIMGERRPLVIGLTTVAAIGVIWFFFVHIFNISLPVPAFVE
nr:tripartite tricarboxylate transporter TctB family protein [Marinicella sp. W31]MDC2876175.1 tripartite tricarboxylate transporter TctB family protein [Marinicella sp. W31]